MLLTDEIRQPSLANREGGASLQEIFFLRHRRQQARQGELVAFSDQVIGFQNQIWLYRHAADVAARVQRQGCRDGFIVYLQFQGGRSGFQIHVRHFGGDRNARYFGNQPQAAVQVCGAQRSLLHQLRNIAGDRVLDPGRVGADHHRADIAFQHAHGQDAVLHLLCRDIGAPQRVACVAVFFFNRAQCLPKRGRRGGPGAQAVEGRGDFGGLQRLCAHNPHAADLEVGKVRVGNIQLLLDPGSHRRHFARWQREDRVGRCRNRHGLGSGIVRHGHDAKNCYRADVFHGDLHRFSAAIRLFGMASD